MTVEKQTIQALKWASLAKIGGQIVSWALTLVVLRILSPADYGLMALVTVMVSILGGLSEFGLGASIVQSPDLRREDLARVSGAALVLNVAAGVLLVLAAPLMAPLFGDPELPNLVRVAALHFLIAAVSTVPAALAQRDMDFKALARAELIAIILSAIGTFWLAWLGAGVWALLIGSLAQAGIRATLLMARGFVWPEFSTQGLAPFMRFGGAVTLSQLMWQVVYQSDILIAGRRLTSDAVGVYSVSLHLATLPMQKIMGIVNQVAFPAVAKLQGEAERLRERLLSASSLLVVFSVPAMWGISAVAPEIVDAVLGPKWKAAVFPLQVICLIVPLRLISGVYATAARGVGQAFADLRNTVTTAIVLPSSFFVGSFWGVDGLALGWVVGIPLVMLINFARILGAVGLRPSDVGRAVWPAFAAGILMYAAVWAARMVILDLPPLVRLGCLIFVGATAYISLLAVTRPQTWGQVSRLIGAARA
jgi:teichuronic acid exporter